MSATLIMMAVNDLFITAVLSLYLRKAQSSFSEYELSISCLSLTCLIDQKFPRRTQSAIRLLIVYTIETGLVTR